MNIIVADKEIRFPERRMSEDEFFDFCMANQELCLERDSAGNIVVLEPTGTYGSFKEAAAVGELFIWNQQSKAGYVASSNAGFTLPNGAVRSPDAAWIRKDRFDALPERDKNRFSHICPDFVIEVRSESDSLKQLQDKMDEYLVNGCRLGFLIDPYAQQAWVYRPNEMPQQITDFNTQLSGGNVLPGYRLSLELFLP